MKLIHLYLLRIFLFSFLLTLFASISLFLVVDFSEKFDDLMATSITARETAEYFVCKIPSIIKEVMAPVSVLATLITYGILLHRREILALHSVGISPKRYGAIFIWMGLILSLSYALFTDVVERPFRIKSSRFWSERVKYDIHGAKRQIKKGEIWYATKDAIYHIGYYDPQNKILYHISINFVDEKFKLHRRIEAKQMAWENNGWVAKDAVVLDIGNTVNINKAPYVFLSTQESPSDFSAFQTSPEELSIETIFHIISLMEKEGVNPRFYLVELHLRFANALSMFVSLFIVVAIISRCSGRALSYNEFRLGAYVMLGFGSFFGLFQLGTALASSGMVPVIAGIWGSHALALIVTSRILR